MRLSFTALALLGLLLAGCSKDPLYQRQGKAFERPVTISIWGLPDDQAERHTDAVLADLQRISTKLHAWHPSSVTQLNEAFERGEAIPVDEELLGLLKQSIDYEQRSDGLFEPGIGRLVAAWGFHQDTPVTKLPDAVTVAALLSTHPTLADLHFDGSEVSSSNPALALDLDAVATGWALDRSAAYLRKHRVFNALITVGDNAIALGRNGSVQWKVSIRHPRKATEMATVLLQSGEAVALAGDFQRYFMVGNKRYSRLIDPHSGAPAQTMQAALVITPPTLEAAAIAAAATQPVFIGGIDNALGYARRFGAGEVLLIANDGDAYSTPGLQARLKWLAAPTHLYRLR